MILSRHNRRVKDIRRLRRCKGELAILEGPHLLREAIESGVEPVEVLATADWLASAEGLSLVARGRLSPLEIEPTLLRELADADSPQGVLTTVRLPRQGVEALPQGALSPYIYGVGLQDPGNLGALARVCEAAGAAGLALAPSTVHPNHPRALRASAGSLLRLPVAVGVEEDALRRHLATSAPVWAALVPVGGADLYRSELPRVLVLVLGAEGPGLPAALSARCELPLTVPLAAPVESLNATVAAAVALFELRRRVLVADPAVVF